MIALGNFIFKHRNWIFLLFYGALFIPSAQLFSEKNFGPRHYLWSILLGLLITVSGQLIRGLTIGLVYIIRGGKNNKPHAEELVTKGMFGHCRNPLYVGNILMLLGMGILANSVLYVLVIVPVFIFLFHAMVLAEEQYLRQKFGESFIRYCQKVNRWLPDFRDIKDSFRQTAFNGKRWLLKEHTTQLIWLSGILLVLVFKYPSLYQYDDKKRMLILGVGFLLLISLYLLIRFQKKTGKLSE